MDFVVYRELTGGIYFGERGVRDNGNIVYDTCTYSRKEIERISHLAFKEARKRKVKLTLVDKANVLSTSRLWREVVQDISKNDFPEVLVDYLFIDNAAMKIITNPSDFGVILTENMFGDILSDEAAQVVGGLGLAPSANIGEKFALFEPVHGAAPDIAGKNIANPIAMILSIKMMMDWFYDYKNDNECKIASEIIHKAVVSSLENNVKTIELGGNSSTEKIGKYIA